MRRRALSLTVGLAATSFMACGDDAPGGAPDAGASPADASVDAGFASDAGMGDAGCSLDATVTFEVEVPPERDAGSRTCTVDPGADLTRDPSCPASVGWFRFVRGRVESESAAVFDAFPQVCVRNQDDRLACLTPEPTCSDGSWSKEIPPEFRCARSIVMRTSKPTGGIFAATYCDLELSGEGVLELPAPIDLYPVEPALRKPPLCSAAAPRVVQLQDGVELEVTPGDFETCFPEDTACPDYARLGVRRLDASDPTPCFVDPADPPDALYAFTVEIDVEGEGFPVRLDNHQNLAPDTVVDLFVQGALACELADGTPIEEGEWVRVGTATVSSDGQHIEGGRLPCLNWFGYRAR
jgi:hypothetical protein